MDPHYQLDLLGGLIQRDIAIEVVAGDSMAQAEVVKAKNVTYLNFRGDQNPRAPALVKMARVLKYYARLLQYAMTTDSRVFHIQWPNKFKYFDRTWLNLFYKCLGKKLVFTAHNVNAGVRDGTDSFLNRFTLRCQYCMADHIIVHTSRLKQELVDSFRQPPGKISVIPHGLNTVVLGHSQTRQSARQSLGLGPRQKVLLFFGNILPYKGLEHLIAALGLLVVQGWTDLRVIIAGRASANQAYWQSIQDRIRKGRLEAYLLQKIEFIPDSAIEILFKAADGLVLPYKYSTQSGPLFIAYAYGLPVIATDVGSFREDVVELKTGLICQPENPDDLASAIRRYFESSLYRDLDHRRQIIQDYANERYSWTKVGQMTAEVYSQVLPDGHGRKPQPVNPDTLKANKTI